MKLSITPTPGPSRDAHPSMPDSPRQLQQLPGQPGEQPAQLHPVGRIDWRIESLRPPAMGARGTSSARMRESDRWTCGEARGNVGIKEDQLALIVFFLPI